MFAELRYFNRDKENPVDFPDAASMMAQLNEKLYNWFSNNAQYLTGSITLMNVHNDSFTKYPQIGERLGFLGGEFYIEDVRRFWQYGGAMTSTLSISRGYKYSTSGTQQQAIDRIGQKVGMMESENA